MTKVNINMNIKSDRKDEVRWAVENVTREYAIDFLNKTEFKEVTKDHWESPLNDGRAFIVPVKEVK